MIPLWVLLAWWWLQRRQRVRWQRLNYRQSWRLLDALADNLPPADGMVEAWLAQRWADWIEREREALRTLERLRVSQIGWVERR